MLKKEPVFGQHASEYQLFGLSVIGVAIVAFLTTDSIFVRAVAVLCSLFGILVYIGPGHALVHGPHLFLLPIVDLFRLIISSTVNAFRRRSK